MVVFLGWPISSRVVEDHEWVAQTDARREEDEPDPRPRRRWPF